MSVEVMAITRVVDEGAAELRTLYAAGVSSECFPVYEEEWAWIEQRLGRKKPLNRRVFIERFSDFEWQRAKESTDDLAHELREAHAFDAVSTLISTLSARLERDNAMELVTEAREHISRIQRSHMLTSDVDLDDWEHTIREMKQGMILAKQGLQPGIPTGFAHLDHHLGGWMPGSFVQCLGRTGEGKSQKMVMFGWAARKAGRRVGLFCPELNEHEVKCRYHTVASADKQIQEAVGLERSFRNRALLFRRGFNLKTYTRFCQYIQDEVPGRMHLLSGAGRTEQMSVGYIEDRIVNLGLELVLIDPIYLLKPVRLHGEGNTYQEIAWIAESLHRLSETYNVPIIFSNQAHMEGGAREDAPAKDRSFGSKVLLHLVDYVISVRNDSESNTMVCRCTKSRFGVDNFRYRLSFFPNTGFCKELDPVKGDYFNGNHAEADEDDVRAIKDELDKVPTVASGKGKIR